MMLKHLQFILAVLLLLLFVGDTRILVVIVTGIRLAVTVELKIEVVKVVPAESKIHIYYLYVCVLWSSITMLMHAHCSVDIFYNLL